MFETWHFYAAVVYLSISYLLGIEGLAKLFFGEEFSAVPYSMSEKREDVRKGLYDILYQSKVRGILAIIAFACFGFFAYLLSFVPRKILKKMKLLEEK